MDCRHFEDRLEALLAGALAPREEAACRRHAGACPACRELVELAGLGAPPEAAAPPETLVAGVLSRTTGPTCGRVREGLAALPEGVAPEDHRLLDLHLAACESCRATARVLAALALDLPRMAEVAPPPGFTEALLAATRPRPLRAWLRARIRVASERWASWVRRPRFAWEAAFVLTVVLLPAFASPASPLATVPEAAREIVRRDPVDGLENAAGALDRKLDGTLEAVARSRAVRDTGRGLAVAGAAVVELAGRAEALVHDSAREAGESLGTLRVRAASFLVRGGEAEPPAETTNPTPPGADEETK